MKALSVAPPRAIASSKHGIIDYWVQCYEQHYSSLAGHPVFFPFSCSHGQGADPNVRAAAGEWRRQSYLHLNHVADTYRMSLQAIRDYVTWFWAYRVHDLDSHATGFQIMRAFVIEYRVWLRDHIDEVHQLGLAEACKRERQRVPATGVQKAVIDDLLQAAGMGVDT